jgi:S-DNA-T family DNA segregation ATPase FtsK/SpoIIIE
MLFLDMDAAKPTRIQGCYVSENEIEKLVEFIKKRAPLSEAEIDDLEEEDAAEDEQDDLYEEAVQLVIRHRTASTSFLQRQLNIKYDRAMRLLEDMEAEAIIGPNMGDEPREVLVDQQNE